LIRHEHEPVQKRFRKGSEKVQKGSRFRKVSRFKRVQGSEGSEKVQKWFDRFRTVGKVQI